MTRHLRAVAVLTGIVYVLLAGAVILLFIHNMGFVITLSLTTILVVYAAWLLLVGSGKRKLLGIVALVVSIVLGVFAFAYLLADAKNRRALLVVSTLSLVYVLLAGLLRRKYWQDRREAGERAATTHFQKPYLIINPKSGDGRALKAHIPELAKRQGIQVVLTQRGDDVETLAQKAVQNGADVLGISGGDGSIGAAAKVAIEHDLPLVVLPGGTRCHFARDLGLDPERITDALVGFEGVERHIDVGEINGRVFLNNVSFGLYADIVDRPGYREHKVQKTREVLQAVTAGSGRTYDLRFSDGPRHFERAVQVLVGVNRYNTLNVLELGQRSRLDGGVLQVIVLTRLTSSIVRRLLKAVGIHQLRSEHVAEFYEWTTDAFEVGSTTQSLVVGVDGEREVYTVPVRVRVLPGALRVYVPAEGIRGRPQKTFSPGALRQIRRAAAGPVTTD